MAPASIDYGGLMHRAMQRMIADVLRQVQAEGLPGEHHFFITFDTQDEGVELADWLRERYPDDMTIVIQNWFDNLLVDDEGFNITLNFGNSPEPMRIPFDAVQTFVDPSVEFGLRFDHHEHDEDEDEDEEADLDQLLAEVSQQTENKDSDPEDGEKKSADVVSLDKFRK